MPERIEIIGTTGERDVEILRARRRIVQAPEYGNQLGSIRHGLRLNPVEANRLAQEPGPDQNRHQGRLKQAKNLYFQVNRSSD